MGRYFAVATILAVLLGIGHLIAKRSSNHRVERTATGLLVAGAVGFMNTFGQSVSARSVAVAHSSRSMTQ